MTEHNVLDVLLMKKKKYIVLFSGLDFSPVEQITNHLANDFEAIVLNFIHLSLTDSLDPINNRVNDLIGKKDSNPKPLFVIAKTFPLTKLKIPIDLHIHISLHQIAIQRLDPLKRPELSAQYMESIKTNRVNKYINLKKEFEVSEIEDEIFGIIIDDIEKKVYGDDYQTLGSKASKSSISTESKPEPNTKFKSDPLKQTFNQNVPSIQEKKLLATTKAEEEIKDAIDDTEDSLSAEKDTDTDDFLSDEVRILGSGASTSRVR